jgi:hypothetical protein
MKPVQVKPKSFIFDIQNLDAPVYEKMVGEFVEYFSRRKGTLWIGKLGSLSTPGISDIDLMLVCEDTHCRMLTHESEVFISQSPLHRYLFIHNVYVIPQHAVNYLFYFHPLDNLLTLWGDASILNECEQLDVMMRLFRTVLWNSIRWDRTLNYCQQDNVSLRSLLMCSKSLVTAANHNYRLMGNSAPEGKAKLRVEQGIQRILNTALNVQSNLAKALFWESVQILAKSDWDLNAWMIHENISNENGNRKKSWLFEKHVIIFDNSYELQQENFHQHFLGTHITHLPYFYYEIGSLIAQPYVYFEPSLSRIWGTRLAENFYNVNLMEAAENWNRVFMGNVRESIRKGTQSVALEIYKVYPFSVKKVRSTMRRLMSQILPDFFRRWHRTLIHSQGTNYIA